MVNVICGAIMGIGCGFSVHTVGGPLWASWSVCILSGLIVLAIGKIGDLVDAVKCIGDTGEDFC